VVVSQFNCSMSIAGLPASQLMTGIKPAAENPHRTSLAIAKLGAKPTSRSILASA
jgi:hypothetical protein